MRNLVLLLMMPLSVLAEDNAAVNRKFETKYENGYNDKTHCARFGNWFKQMALPSTGVRIKFRCVQDRGFALDTKLGGPYVEGNWKLKLEVESVEGSGVDVQEIGGNIIKAGSDLQCESRKACLEMVDSLSIMMDDVKKGSIYAKCEGSTLKSIFEFEK